MKFKDSQLAHQYLDNLTGIEIGASAHNPFNLPSCRNVDYTDSMDTVFKINEEKLCGAKAKVDIVAFGDELPLKDEEVDYVVSSHVIEHFFDPVKAIKEWLRVIRKGGYVFIICPHNDRIPQETRPITKLEEIIKRHEGKMKPEEVLFEGGHNLSSVSGKDLREDGHGHWSVWNTEAFLEICKHFNFNVVKSLDVDDKVGNGFCVIIQK